jgi:hypothetical protein
VTTNKRGCIFTFGFSLLIFSNIYLKTKKPDPFEIHGAGYRMDDRKMQDTKEPGSPKKLISGKPGFTSNKALIV